MKSFVAFAALLAVAMALPQHHFQPAHHGSEVVLIKETPSNNIGLDSYQYAYELSDGQSRQESAQVEFRGANPEDAVLRVRGSFSWVNPADGQTYTVNYIADENGFQPQGAHLPVA